MLRNLFWFNRNSICYLSARALRFLKQREIECVEEETWVPDLSFRSELDCLYVKHLGIGVEFYLKSLTLVLILDIVNVIGVY